MCNHGGLNCDSATAINPQPQSLHLPNLRHPPTQTLHSARKRVCNLRKMHDSSTGRTAMTYGSLTWADYRCGKCGTYLVKHQTHHGARGDRRCNKCGQQVRENPRVTTETIQKRRMTRHNAN